MKADYNIESFIASQYWKKNVQEKDSFQTLRRPIELKFSQGCYFYAYVEIHQVRRQIPIVSSVFKLSQVCYSMIGSRKGGGDRPTVFDNY